MSDAVVTPAHTLVQFDADIGVVAACHFTKLPNGNLQIAVTTPLPNAPYSIEVDKGNVPDLVRSLVGGFMVPPEPVVVLDTQPAATTDESDGA